MDRLVVPCVEGLCRTLWRKVLLDVIKKGFVARWMQRFCQTLSGKVLSDAIRYPERLSSTLSRTILSHVIWKGFVGYNILSGKVMKHFIQKCLAGPYLEGFCRAFHLQTIFGLNALGYHRRKN